MSIAIPLEIIAKSFTYMLLSELARNLLTLLLGIVVAVRVPDPGVGSDPLGRDPPLQLQQQTQDYNHFFLEYPESACNVIGGDVKNHNRNF